MPFQHVAITGASAGLGRALALALAGPGVVLHLNGRNQARLEIVAREVQARGGQAHVAAADVTDAAAMAAWIGGCGRLDLVIANAGISAGPGGADHEDPARLRAVFATNVDGVFNTLLPALELRPRRIAVIGSIAGLIALPTSPAYSASKAALDFWVRAAAPGLRRAGIGLTLVRPGFIRTGMTAGNPYKMPGLMEAEGAARIILRGLEAGRARITFPWWLALLARFGERLPRRLLARLPDKPA